HRNRIEPEQVQDFYPAPMTLAGAMFYTGVDPITGKPVYVPRTDREKALQRALLLHHKPEFQAKAAFLMILTRWKWKKTKNGNGRKKNFDSHRVFILML
ncbi:MAG: DUF3362 domain-containing protein, partial [Acidobacteria bacterium]|nr:DUF3362 domain-containing protein [Acidobacteriota bacterium]